MKFLHLSSVFPPAYFYGGVPLAALGLARALEQSGHENLVITTDADGRQRLPVKCEEVFEYQGVPVIYTRRLGHNSYFYTPSLASHLKRYAPQFDIALVRGNWGYFNLAARRILAPLGIPYLLYPEGTFGPWAIRHRCDKKVPYWHLLEKYNYQKSAGAVALTKNEARQIKAYLPAVVTEVIPNGIALEDFYPSPDEAGLTKRFPDLAEKPFILFLSRLHPIKGLDLLLHAFAQICHAGGPGIAPPLLVIAGEGDKSYEEYLRRLAAELGLTQKVVFTGMVTGVDKLFLLHGCLFLVLSSRSEGLPVAVLEAMACKKPVIISHWCNLPEVEECQAGLTVGNDPPSIAIGLEKLLINDNLRREMGKNAYALIKEQFTWDSACRQTVDYARRILEAHS